MMKNAQFLAITTILLGIIFLSQLNLINRPVQDNDEGIYLTTFLLIDSGHRAYKETFLSQPPGFLLSVYPGFVVFGKTLPAARLTIGLWSFIGLLAIIWIGYEISAVWASLFTVGLLYLIPSYVNQVVTFQSDILISIFSLLSLASVLRFKRLRALKWFIVSTFFINLAFWTKFDISLFPVFFTTLLLISYQKKDFKQEMLFLSGLFAVITLAFLVLFIVPFDITHVFQDTIGLRLAATTVFPFSLSQFTQFLKRDSILSFTILGSIILSFLKKENFRYPLGIIFLWVVTQIVALCLYRPLFPHHLSILAIPVTLFFSHSFYMTLKSKFKLSYVSNFVIIVTFGSILHFAYIALKTPQGTLSAHQKSATAIIQKNTLPHDLIVSDEEILNGYSGRLPPPELSDISYVRISSNNLTAEQFKNTIMTYKPKLIVAWNGRLAAIKSFNEVIQGYKPLAIFDQSKIIYMRL